MWALLVLRLRAPQAHAQHAVTQADLVALAVSPGTCSCPALPGHGATGAHSGPAFRAGPGDSARHTEREAEAGGDCRTDSESRHDSEGRTESSHTPPPALPTVDMLR